MKKQILMAIGIIAAVTIGGLAAIQMNNWEDNFHQSCEDKYEEAATHKFDCINYSSTKDDVLEAVRANQPATDSEVRQYTNLSSSATKATLKKLEEQQYIFSEDKTWGGQVYKIWNATQQPKHPRNSSLR